MLVLFPAPSGLGALLAMRSKKRIQRASRSYKAKKYARLPIDDSGVVINPSEITLRSVDDDAPGDLPDHLDDGMGVHAHKSVVGPDELVPGIEEPVAQAQSLSGARNLLMWLPAIFDVRLIFTSSSRPLPYAQLTSPLLAFKCLHQHRSAARL